MSIDYYWVKSEGVRKHMDGQFPCLVERKSSAAGCSDTKVRYGCGKIYLIPFEEMYLILQGHKFFRPDSIVNGIF